MYPIRLLSAFLARVPRLTAEEALASAEVAALGAGTLGKESKNVVRRLTRAARREPPLARRPMAEQARTLSPAARAWIGVSEGVVTP